MSLGLDPRAKPEDEEGGRLEMKKALAYSSAAAAKFAALTAAMAAVAVSVLLGVVGRVRGEEAA